MSEENESFVNQNIYRINEFLETSTAKQIVSKYFTKMDDCSDELTSELYFALRKIAFYCDDKGTAFSWYGPEVFRNTLEEYFQQPIKLRDRMFSPKKRDLTEKGKAILNKQRFAYIEMKSETKPFKVLDCQKIRKLMKEAGLTKLQRIVFLLRNKRHLTFEQISKRLDRKSKTIQSHYYRALYKLKAYTRLSHLEMTDLYRNPTKNEEIELA